MISLILIFTILVAPLSFFFLNCLSMNILILFLIVLIAPLFWNKHAPSALWLSRLSSNANIFRWFLIISILYISILIEFTSIPLPLYSYYTNNYFMYSMLFILEFIHNCVYSIVGNILLYFYNILYTFLLCIGSTFFSIFIYFFYSNLGKFLIQLFFYGPLLILFFNKNWSSIKPLRIIQKINLSIIALFLFITVMSLIYNFSLYSLYFILNYETIIINLFTNLTPHIFNYYVISETFSTLDFNYNNNIILLNKDFNLINYFHILSPVEDGTSAPASNPDLSTLVATSAPAPATNTEVNDAALNTATTAVVNSGSNTVTVSVANGRTDVHFSFDNETIKQMTSTAGEVLSKAIKDNYVGSGVGAVTASKVAAQVLQPVPMIPAHKAALILTAATGGAIAGGSVVDALGAMEDLNEFARDQIANSPFNAEHPEGRAPSPSNVFGGYSPLEKSSVGFTVSFSDKYSPIQLIINSILVFQLLNLFSFIFLSYIFVVQVFSKSYGTTVIAYLENNNSLSFLPTGLKNFITKIVCNFFNLNGKFIKYIGIFYICLVFFNLFCSIFLLTELTLDLHKYLEMYQVWYDNQ